MVKRHADGVLVAACASSCLDVLPSQLHRAADQPVLSAIENLPTTFNQDTSRFGSNKKQCRLISDQGPKPFEASSLFAQARAVLRQPASAVQDAPIGREQEFEALTQAVNDFRSSGSGSSIYVSGLPGTGKSHTVRKTLTHFLSSSSSSSSTSSAQPQCLVTWINCMSVSSAGEVYAQVAATARAGHSNDWQQQQHQQQEQPTNDYCDDLPLFDNQQQQSQPQQQSLSYDALLDCLQQQHKRPSANSRSSGSRGTKRYRATRASTAADAKLSSRSSSPSSSDDSSQPQQPPPHIVVLDEIDNIAKKSLPDLVQLFKLPHEPGVSVLVVGIANSIDLTERTLPELKLQLVTPRLITFNAYSAKQLGAILEGVMRQLPSQLFSPPALQLVCRSVGASSGDLRHALKACRAAIDELEQQHQQQTEAAITSALNDSFDGCAPAAPAPASLTVGPKQMSLALAKLAGVRSAQFGAQAASIVRSLPNQQQMLLYSLAVLCKQPEQDAAGNLGAQDPVTPSKGSKAAASSLWKGAGSAAVLSSSGAGAGSPAGAGGSWSGLKKKKKAAVGGNASQAGPQGSVFVLAVTADAAYHQYSQVCKLLKLPACSKGELLHMADLLAQMALLDIIKTPTGPAGSSTGSKSAFKGSGSAAGGLKGFKGSASSKLGGLGGSGRGLLGGASRSGLGGLSGSPMGSAANAAQQGEVKLSLRASSSEVFGALKHNPALRCLVDA